jgi:hypothetical protein
MQVVPAGQTWHSAPHALLSLLVSTQVLPHTLSEPLHDSKQALVDVQASVAGTHCLSHRRTSVVVLPQVMQVPPQHVPSPPQEVPSAKEPIETQVGDPVLHEMARASQSFGPHEAPATQGLQAPPKQTSFVPHGVPSGKTPVCTHVASPLAQLVAPVWQTLPLGVHAAPGAHGSASASPLSTLAASASLASPGWPPSLASFERLASTLCRSSLPSPPSGSRVVPPAINPPHAHSSDAATVRRATDWPLAKPRLTTVAPDVAVRRSVFDKERCHRLRPS